MRQPRQGADGDSLQGQRDPTALVTRKARVSQTINLEEQGSSKQLDLDEILKAAREAAATHGEEWLLRQLKGEGTGDCPAPDTPGDAGDNDVPRCKDNEREEPRKCQRNESRRRRTQESCWRRPGHLHPASSPR
ncbi:hypothetical protein NDU88_005793 [Pleurodeles waltl]|uniref:Uncharacterized protein n=1 Tax=Pleurodeles waltl TaxID=8319 RepID=A0AAV7NQ30_PLEWA|nr:hypothetical protein NDU88_005793 [Pleurodeles waltl]